MWDRPSQQPPAVAGYDAERLARLKETEEVAASSVFFRTGTQQAAAAKLELVDEMIAQLNAELGESSPNEREAEEQLERLDQSAGDLYRNRKL